MLSQLGISFSSSLHIQVGSVIFQKVQADKKYISV